MNVIIEVKTLDYNPESNDGYVEVLIEDYTNIKEDDGIEGYPINLFSANFTLNSTETLPSDPEELCMFFEELDLDWKLMPL
jgi:hypothetical protein